MKGEYGVGRERKRGEERKEGRRKRKGKGKGRKGQKNKLWGILNFKGKAEEGKKGNEKG